MAAQVLDVPRSLRRGGKLDDVDTSVDYMHRIISLICRKMNLDDLGESRVLDMGCGWRMAKTFLENDLPIKQYVGIDVFRDMVEFLQSQISDPRFLFKLLNAHNEMYNPEGTPLGEVTSLGLPEESFDVICLWSVFTHLAPHDYVSMLRLLRPYVQPEGRLIFSLLVNETTPDGIGFIDGVQKQWAANPEALAQNQEGFEKHFQETGVPDFTDFDPAQPLKWALYSREHALELIEGTGWEVVSLNYPEKAVPHYMICAPV